jgi:hypothetical protein
MIENPGGSSAPSSSMIAAGTVGVEAGVSVNVGCGVGVSVKNDVEVGTNSVAVLVADVGWHATRKSTQSIMKREKFI